MDKTLLIFVSFINVTAAYAAAASMCTLKRDVSYTCFTQFSNDAKAYETFFMENFSECASMTDNEPQMPINSDDRKSICDKRRESAYYIFKHYSKDKNVPESNCY